MLQNNEQVTEEIKRKIKKILETNDKETWWLKTYRMQKKKQF